MFNWLWAEPALTYYLVFLFLYNFSWVEEWFKDGPHVEGQKGIVCRMGNRAGGLTDLTGRGGAVAEPSGEYQLIGNNCLLTSFQQF